jgi:hypothetical protein
VIGAIEINNISLDSGPIFAALTLPSSYFAGILPETRSHFGRRTRADRAAIDLPFCWVVSGDSGALLGRRRLYENRRWHEGKKIEQETSQKCLKSEYLTLLSSFSVIEHMIQRAPGPAAGVLLYRQPPKSFNEKELYGR